MSLYYPQGGVVLGIIWEDFGNTGNNLLNDIYKLPILARNIRVEINDYKEADTFKLEIDYKSFPFDPRCIRQCRVTIHLEDRKSIYRGIGSALNILKPTTENTIFIGYADEESIDFDDDSRIVTMEGRDLTSLFTDVKYLGQPISLAKPIDVILKELFGSLISTENIEIVNRTGEDLPILSKFAPDLETTSSILNPKRGATFWDMVQDVISRAGLIGYMELDKFIVTKPRNLYKKVNIKQFFYGKNLKSLKFSRKLGRHKDFNVLIRSANLKQKSVIEAKIPLESVRADLGGGLEVTVTQLDKDGKKIEPPKAAEYLTFNVTDIINKEKLIEIGESVYEELSRQQIEGSLSTFEMEIPEITGTNSSGNIYKPVSFATIRNGTPIRISIDVDDISKIRTLSSVAERKKYLIQQQYAPDVAEAFAQSMNRIATPFYTKAVTFTLDQNNGFSMDLDFINFIELDNAKLGV